MKKPPIFFHNALASGLRRRNEIKQLLLAILKKNHKELKEINVWFMDNKQIRSVNKKHLFHDYATDVITFVYEASPVFADICVGTETIVENAEVHETSKEDEFLRVLVHALLHMVGYKDKTQKEKNEMRKTENFWIEKFHVKQEKKNIPNQFFT